MRRAFAVRERLVLVLCALSVGLVCAASVQVAAAPSQPPSVFSISSSSTRAVVLESVSMRGEPFSLNSAGNFSPADPRTRVTLFGTNFEFLQGESGIAQEVWQGSQDAQDSLAFELLPRGSGTSGSA